MAGPGGGGKREMKRLLGALLATLTIAAAADEVETRLQRGLDAYRGGRYATALEELALAAGGIQQRLGAEYRALLPAPPAGWDADEAEVRALTAPGAGVQLSRRYFREEEELALEISVDSPLSAGLGLLLTDPKLLAADPAARPYRHGDYRGLVRRSGDELELSLLIGERLLLRLSGSNLKEDGVPERLLGAIDFAALSRKLLN